MADPWTRPRTLLEAVLADGLSAHREAIHEALRRIPELEAERNSLSEAVARQADDALAFLRDHHAPLEAERDQLRAELAALKNPAA